jgi:hypothetical protein
LLSLSLEQAAEILGFSRGTPYRHWLAQALNDVPGSAEKLFPRIRAFGWRILALNGALVVAEPTRSLATDSAKD